METNGKFFKNAAGTWQKFHVPKTLKDRKDPFWSKKNFVPEKESIAKGSAVECKYCKEIKIPLAYHPMKKKIKFCSFEHGKLYMFTNPDTRYINKTLNFEMKF